MKLEQRNGKLEFNENEVTVTLDLRQSKKFYGEVFDTESIDAELFIKSIKEDAPVLFNHRAEQIVSDDYDVTANNGIVTVKVRLDERNMYANTILSLREKSQKRLGCSFGFHCLKEEIRNKHRIVKDLIVSEISILSCESAYPSSVRCLENNEIRELTMEELQEMINKSVQEALKVKEEPKEEIKVEEVKKDIKEEPKPIEPKQVDAKPIEVKLNADDLKNVFNDFLDGFKSVMPKHEVAKEEPKSEVKAEVKAEEPKVEEKPTKVDDEKVKADVEKYKQMLAELE